jgi:hypothetical protein
MSANLDIYQGMLLNRHSHIQCGSLTYYRHLGASLCLYFSLSFFICKSVAVHLFQRVFCCLGCVGIVIIRQDTSGYVRIRQDTSGYVSIKVSRSICSDAAPAAWDTSAYVGILQHTSAYVSIRQRSICSDASPAAWDVGGCSKVGTVSVVN